MTLKCTGKKLETISFNADGESFSIKTMDGTYTRSKENDVVKYTFEKKKSLSGKGIKFRFGGEGKTDIDQKVRVLLVLVLKVFSAMLLIS